MDFFFWLNVSRGWNKGVLARMYIPSVAPGRSLPKFSHILGKIRFLMSI